MRRFCRNWKWKRGWSRGATMLQRSQVSLIYRSVSCVRNIRWDRTWERACSKHGME